MSDKNQNNDPELNKGDSEALYELGESYYNGDNGKEQSYEKAMDAYKKASELQSHKAQYSLGFMYEHGLGVEKSYVDAVKWYSVALDNGNYNAAGCLASLYARGVYFQKDYGRAEELYLKGIELGDTEFYAQLAYIYLSKDRNKENLAKVSEYLDKGISAGDGQCMGVMGHLFYDGTFEKDLYSAEKYLLMSIKAGYTESYEALIGVYGTLYDETGDDSFKQKMYDAVFKGTDAGVSFAMVVKGRLLISGEFGENREEEAFKLFTDAAELNDVEAAIELFDMYINGVGVEESIDKALEVLLQFEDSDADAVQYFLGSVYSDPDGGHLDIPKAIEYYEKAIAYGSIEAYSGMAEMYLIDECGVKDVEKAAELFQKGAELGDSSSYYYLGYMYDEGIYFSQSKEEAFKCFTKASELGNSKSCWMIARAYSDGTVVEKSEEKYLEWLQKAVDFDVPEALYEMGGDYYFGEHVEKSIPDAYQYFSRAYKLGDVSSGYFLGMIYKDGCEGIEPSIEEAIRYLEEVVETDDVYAMLDLGSIYYDEDSGAYDVQKALNCYMRGAELGNSTCMSKIGAIYWFESLPGWEKVAPEWLRKAVENGDEGAKSYLSDCLMDLKQYEEARIVSESNLDDSCCVSNLATMYMEGLGTRVDYKKGIRYINLAFELNNESIGSYCISYLFNDNYKAAHKNILNVLESQSKAGNIYAMSALAHYYAESECSVSKRKQVFDLAKNAAMGGDKYGYYSLFLAFDSGYGVNVDKKLSMQALYMGASKGDASCKIMLHGLFGKGPEKPQMGVSEWFNVNKSVIASKCDGTLDVFLESKTLTQSNKNTIQGRSKSNTDTPNDIKSSNPSVKAVTNRSDFEQIDIGKKKKKGGSKLLFLLGILNLLATLGAAILTLVMYHDYVDGYIDSSYLSSVAMFAAGGIICLFAGIAVFKKKSKKCILCLNLVSFAIICIGFITYDASSTALILSIFAIIYLILLKIA